MSEFLLALPTVLRHEGGYVNNPNDPGGATKYGISLRWLKSQGLHGDVNGDLVVDIADILALTPDTAAGFYRVNWWEKYGFGRVIDQTVATKVFDTAVNMGTPRAVKFAQQAAIALGFVLSAPDGLMGPNTVLALNSLPAANLLHKYQDLQAGFYRQLATDPKLTQFLAGWLNRAYDRV